MSSCTLRVTSVNFVITRYRVGLGFNSPHRVPRARHPESAILQAFRPTPGISHHHPGTTPGRGPDPFVMHHGLPRSETCDTGHSSTSHRLSFKAYRSIKALIRPHISGPAVIWTGPLAEVTSSPAPAPVLTETRWRATGAVQMNLPTKGKGYSSPSWPPCPDE